MTRREMNRLKDKHFAYLGDLLSAFYRFLGKKPQPSDQEVRGKFILGRTKWTNYCVKHGLDAKTREEFTRQVSIVWYKKTKDSSSQETQSMTGK